MTKPYPRFSKLTPEAVKEIRESKLLLKQLAAKFGVSEGAISMARTGKTWKRL